MTILFVCYTIVSLYRLCPFSILQHFLKESKVNEMMKNINVQHEVDDYQKNEKIEDQCPRVCTSAREYALTICLIFGPDTWRFWKNVLDMR